MSSQLEISGSYVALVTPFSDGEVDYEVLVAPTSSRKLSTSPGAYVAWSPDGTQFAYTLIATTRQGSSSSIAIYDLATGDTHDTEAAPPGGILLGWRPALPE